MCLEEEFENLQPTFARPETYWVTADQDPFVRYELAENPRLPLTVLIALVNDENPYVSFRAEQTLEKALAVDARSVAA